MNKKSFLAGLILVTALINPASQVDAVDTVKVKVDGRNVNFIDALPYFDEKANRVLIPVRFVSEEIGAKVDWNEAKKQVTITKNGKTIVLTIGSKRVIVDGKTITIDVAAFTSQNRTYVPIRFVSEAFGAKVSWDDAQDLVEITTGDTVTPTPTVPTNGKPSDVVTAEQNFISTLKIENGKLSGILLPLPKDYDYSISYKGKDQNGKRIVVYVSDQYKEGQGFSFNYGTEGYMIISIVNKKYAGDVGYASTRIEIPSLKVKE